MHLCNYTFTPLVGTTKTLVTMCCVLQIFIVFLLVGVPNEVLMEDNSQTEEPKESPSEDDVPQSFTVTLGATVPTGFEYTAAEEVLEKIGAKARVSKDRGRIYFEITTDNLPKVCTILSIRNKSYISGDFLNGWHCDLTSRKFRVCTCKTILINK